MSESISFSCIGLDFDAEVDIDPGQEAILTGPWENSRPGYAPEMDILTMTHEGKDASFLLCSDVQDEIVEAAWDAVMAGVEQSKIDAAEARAEARAESMWF